MQELKTLWWDQDAVCMIDQRILPQRIETIRCSSVAETAQAIKAMVVRGAPAIGCTAAYGMVLAALHSSATTGVALLADLAQAQQLLNATRPTAVNLAWATARIYRLAKAAGSDPAIRTILLKEAHAIVAEDLAMCHAIGEHGVRLIPAGGNVLTHCNAGGLATAGYGTALAPIRTAHRQGRSIHVWVDETRPFLQGARLTAWELQQAGIPLTLITDSMAGYMMAQGQVDCVIVGADRVVANGDIANKIGTYSLAVLAQAHQIPFYIAAPTSTIDLSLADGSVIPIEQRSASEVTHLAGVQIAPDGVHAAHPAFDVTPARLITAIITERGVLWPPYQQSIAQLRLE